MKNIRKQTIRVTKKAGIVLLAAFTLFSQSAAADEPESYHEAELLNVIVPASLDFTVDPFEIAGRGQIYSIPYRIENRGDEDVLLTFSDMRVLFSGEGEFEMLSEPFDINSGSSRKAICLYLNFDRGELPPVILTDQNRAEEMSIILCGAGTDAEGLSDLALTLSGSVNHAPGADWSDGDVKINIHYRLELVPSEEEILTDPEAGQDEERTQDEEQGQDEERPDETAPPSYPEEDINTEITTPGAIEGEEDILPGSEQE
jgi:hypothetical protein